MVVLKTHSVLPRCTACLIRTLQKNVEDVQGTKKKRKEKTKKKKKQPIKLEDKKAVMRKLQTEMRKMKTMVGEIQSSLEGYNSRVRVA